MVTSNANAFNGFYTPNPGQEMPPNYTVGVNYTILSNLSVYGRYADSYQTGGENAEPAEIKLYEAGVTYAGYGVIGTVRGFRTLFNHQSFGGGVDPDNANLTQGFFANSDTNGVDIDVNYRPTFEVLHAVSIHGQLTYQKTAFNNVSTGVITVNGQNIASQVATFYDGKTTPQTPSLLYTITHQRRRGRLGPAGQSGRRRRQGGEPQTDAAVSRGEGGQDAQVAPGAQHQMRRHGTLANEAVEVAPLGHVELERGLRHGAGRRACAKRRQNQHDAAKSSASSTPAASGRNQVVLRSRDRVA